MKGWLVFFVLLVVLLASCTTEKTILEKKEKSELAKTEQEQKETGGEFMGKVLFIIAQIGYQDKELGTPKEIVENAGYKAEVASLTTDTASGALGGRLKPDLAVKDANIDDYDLIVVVGGPGSPELAKHNEVLNLLSQAKENNKKLGAICLAPMVLAKAGVLQGKRATVFKTSESIAALEQGGASLEEKDVVVDTDLVTANGPGAAQDFGDELVRLVQG
ncbi:DJ-1/PfpI family protein [Candidatus Woesearchaeota archaeon]|nr:DJ-1/PfpI family protein [Candidatus Woesearchaeota archaeon]